MGYTLPDLVLSSNQVFEVRSFFGGKPMEILIVPIQPVSTQGHNFATEILWPSCGPPNDKPLALFPVDEESSPLAFSSGEHFGNMTRRRGNVFVLPYPKLWQGQTLPKEVAELVKGYRPVIVACRIDRANADQVIKLRTMLEKASGEKVLVGALENGAGKNNGLVVCTPTGA